MTRRLVVCFGWEDAEASPEEYLAAAARVHRAMADIGAEPIAWSAERYSFTFTRSAFTPALHATLELLRFGDTHGVGIADRELARDRFGRHWGPALGIAEALARSTRRGEALLDSEVSALADRELASVGSLHVDWAGERIKASLLVAESVDSGYEDSPLPPDARPTSPRLTPITPPQEHTIVELPAWHTPMTLAHRDTEAAPSPGTASQTLPAAGPPVPLPPRPMQEEESEPIATPRMQPPPEILLGGAVVEAPRTPGRLSAPPPKPSSARLSQPPPKPSTVRSPQRASVPPPKPSRDPAPEQREPPRFSRIESLRQHHGEAEQMFLLVDDLWVQADTKDRDGTFIHSLTEPTGTTMEDGLERLQGALSANKGEDMVERSQIALAYAICLAKAGKPAEALLESLQALATARRSGHAQAERACEILLAQLARYTGQPELAERWLKIPRPLQRSSG